MIQFDYLPIRWFSEYLSTMRRCLHTSQFVWMFLVDLMFSCPFRPIRHLAKGGSGIVAFVGSIQTMKKGDVEGKLSEVFR